MTAYFRLRGEKIQLSEKDVEKACVQLLRWKHYYPLRLQSGLFIPAEREVIQTLRNAGVRFRIVTIGEPGIPDYVIPRSFVELKAPGNDVSEVQKQKIWTLEKQWDLKTAVISSVDELVEWLAHHEEL